jgi:hypothetical protein
MQRISFLVLVNVILVILMGVLVAEQFVLLQNLKDATAVSNPINAGAGNVQFTPWELQTWGSIKNRVVVYNADPEFTGNRILQWISMRNSSSGDYYQKSMEYLCFWEGRGANGEWEAVVSIYNSPNSTSDFVVEAARFTWHSLDVLLDGSVVASFPQVSNDTVSVGYATFHVAV